MTAVQPFTAVKGLLLTVFVEAVELGLYLKKEESGCFARGMWVCVGNIIDEGGQKAQT